MKKIISVFLMLIFALATFAGCGSESASSEGGSITKLGLGHLTSIGKSKDLGTDKDGKEVLPLGQVDTVIIAAAFDSDGKVVKVTIDNAQTKVKFNKDLSLESDTKATFKTKVELGEEYGMVKASSIGKEWYQQAEELGNWMVGRTIEEIKGMKVVERDASHPSVPDESELKSLVTITVQDYIAAVEEAYNNAVEVEGDAVTLGLGHEISIGKSKGLGTDKDGKEVLPVAQVDTVMAATLFDKDGKVVRAVIDNAQTKVEFDKDGKVTTDKNGEFKTKVELGDEYGMIKVSSIKKNWYEQIAELEKWMAGKSIDEIKGMKVTERDAAHPAVPDESELKSLVTMTVQDYIAVVAEASANAK